MSDYAFRQFVRDEVIGWLGQQKFAFDQIIASIGNELSPRIVAEVQRGILVRLDKLQPDERELVHAFLLQLRTLLSVATAPESHKELLAQARNDVQTVLKLIEAPKPQTRGAQA